MKLDEIRERLRTTGDLALIKLPEVPKARFKLLSGAHVEVVGDLNPPPPEQPTPLPTKVRLCYRCYLPEAHEAHRLDHTVGIDISEDTARRTLRHGHLADDFLEDTDGGPVLFGHDFVPSLEVDLCLCGVEPSIASFEIGKKLPSLPGGPSSYVFARAQVRPGDTDVPLCGKCVKILEGMGFTADPF